MGLISDIGQWLDRKFPDKVIVTEAAYLAMRAQLETIGECLREQDTRIKNLCKEVVTIANAAETMNTDMNKLKIAAGFRATAPHTNVPPGFQTTMPPVTAQR